MAGNRVLLDTNIIAAILNQEAEIGTRLEGVIAYVPSVVLGELYYGAKRSARVAENIQRIETLIAGYEVLVCDGTTAERYGDIKLRLRLKGRPIPENDIWIAAVAAQHDLKLVTRDKHFDEIDGLAVEAW